VNAILKWTLTILAGIAVVAGVSGNAAAQQALAQRVIGSYTLVSITFDYQDGTKADLFGANVRGSLMLNPNGRFSLQIIGANRPKFAASNRREGTAEENAAAIYMTESYFGTFSIDAADRSVTYHLERAIFPNWDGTDRKFSIVVSGDELQLSGPPTASAKGSYIPRQVWKRAVAARADSARDELAPTGRLRLAIAISSLGGAFWSAKDAAGNPTGVPVDLGKELARRLGVPVAYVMYENSGQITDAASKGEWDVTFVPIDAERAKKLAFGPIYNGADATYIVRAGSPIQSAEQLDQPGVKVAAVADTTTMRGASLALKNTKVVGYQSVDEILALLTKGEVDAFANLRDQLLPLSARMPGTRVLPGAFQQTKTAVAVPLGRPNALAYASKFLDDAKTGGFLRRSLDAHGLKDTPIYAVPGS